VLFFAQIPELKRPTPLCSKKALSFFGNYIYNCNLEFPASIFKLKYYKNISSGYRRDSNKAMQLILSKKIESKSFDILFETVMYIYRNRLAISELPITYAFSNSSPSPNVVKDSLKMCFNVMCKPIK